MNLKNLCLKFEECAYPKADFCRSKEYKNCLIYQRLSEPLGIGSPSPEDWINKIIKYKNKKK